MSHEHLLEDELRQIVLDGMSHVDNDWRATKAVAEAILAAGYRKPSTVTTINELNKLPAGAEILPYGYKPSQAVCVKRSDGTFVSHKGVTFAAHIGLPATVLYVPEEL